MHFSLFQKFSRYNYTLVHFQQKIFSKKLDKLFVRFIGLIPRLNVSLLTLNPKRKALMEVRHILTLFFNAGKAGATYTEGHAPKMF